jgi:hypothetical protein
MASDKSVFIIFPLFFLRASSRTSNQNIPYFEICKAHASMEKHGAAVVGKNEARHRWKWQIT